MTNATTTRKPLRFDSETAAETWLRDTHNTGRYLPDTGAIVQFADGGVWAFTASDETVLLPDW